MAKVVTSAGLNEFVQDGKFETIKDAAPKADKDAPLMEAKQEVQNKDLGEQGKVDAKVEAEAKAEIKDEGLEADDAEFPEKVRKRIAKKHREMKEAQEALAESERFAENQYNRARVAEERAQQLERESAELKAKVQPKKEPEKEPELKDFTNDKGEVNWTGYTKAAADFAAKKAVAEDRAKRDEEARALAAKAAEDQAKARVAETIKRHPDFQEVVSASDVRTHNAVLEYLTSSEQIGEVTYYLATHPEFVERINKLHPLKAIAEIGKLELTFEPKAEVKTDAEPQRAQKTGGAPAPITPISGQGNAIVQTDPSKMSYKELRAYHRQQRATKH
jgi:hypothetical protein